MFLKRSKTGLTLHYVNANTNSQNQAFSSWFKLELHQDYIDCLRELGHPPPTETKALLQDLKAFEALKIKTATLEDKTTTLEDRNDALERQILELQKSFELERQTTDSIKQILHNAKSK